MFLYNQLDDIKIYCGNCIQWKPQKVDHIVTDPPYGINFQNNKWDKQFDICWYFPIIKNSVKQNGNIIVFQGWSNVCDTINKFKSQSYILHDWIIWDRIKGRGAKKHFVSTRQDILWFSQNEDYVFNVETSKIKKKTGGSIGKRNGCEYRKLSNVWYDISPIVPWSSERVEHPTQKPLEIMERIIRIFTNQNDTVLDMFAGSGTTGVACLKNNRKCILIEQSEKYCEIIYNRLLKEKNKMQQK